MSETATSDVKVPEANPSPTTGARRRETNPSLAKGEAGPTGTVNPAAARVHAAYKAQDPTKPPPGNLVKKPEEVQVPPTPVNQADAVRQAEAASWNQHTPAASPALAGIVPTMEVTMIEGGHKAVINEGDFDPSLHEASKDHGKKSAGKRAFEREENVSAVRTGALPSGSPVGTPVDEKARERAAARRRGDQVDETNDPALAQQNQRNQRAQGAPGGDEESPVKEENASDAIDKIGRMTSREKLEEIVRTEDRTTVKAAAEKRLGEV